MAKLVSQVYAEALFGLGVENGLLDTLLEELNGMCEILGENPQFVTLLGLSQQRTERILPSSSGKRQIWRAVCDP